ncbi:hypothetical protein MUK42_05393 [Musa troglodytarum]|uniref:DUF547 domain-containing protein n=1 Tax=Musa troglodytarum TaxID=320322 RepID=A0A9E7JEF8_9LILI|nr:hypothetical protein MUK42_05393 [Musa troglodytarum]
MAFGDDGRVAVLAAHAVGKQSNSIQHRRLELEKEMICSEFEIHCAEDDRFDFQVAELQRVLRNEEKMHEVLEHAMLPPKTRSTLQIPGFLPRRTKELLAEVVMVEEEIARLEREISKAQESLSNMQETQEKETPKFYERRHANRNVIEPPSNMSETNLDVPNCKLSQKIALETKPLFFINQAIKGDYLVNGFIKKGNVGSLNRSDNHNENQCMVEIKERASRKNGRTEKASSIKFPGKHPTNQNAKVENVLKLFREPSSTINLTDQNAGNYHPNKLSEKILNFLICIFLRLSRMSRALDLEKSSNLSKSANLLLRSGSFEIDGSSIRKGRIPAQREIRHHDPYGIFEIEGSILRDIGPYKNLIKFTSSSLDDKDISNSLPLLKKLRILISRLREVDLRSLRHQEKLAFWINVYHTCIMHGSLELGMPSNPEMVQVVKDKALLDVGGSKLNARAIEHLILRQPFNYNETEWKFQEDDKEVIRRNYGLEHSDPNIVFALCSGCKSSPAVRIYTADGVTGELEKSKLDYLQASIAVTANRRVMIPHFLFSKMHDFATDLDSLAEWIIKQLPTSWPLRKSMLECFKGHTDGKTSNMVDVIPNDSEFQYLLRV